MCEIRFHSTHCVAQVRSSSTMPNTATASTKGKKKAESDAPQDAPPEKKAKSSGTDEGKKEEEKLTPHKAFFKRLQEKVNELDTPKGEMLGHILIRGISSNRDSDDEESESESEEDQDKYTEEQMNSLRFILITKNRAKMMDDMREFVLGEQANESFMMFNTSFSWEILSGFSHFKKNIYQKKKSWKLQFDVLFAYTHVLHSHDYWMSDNEGKFQPQQKPFFINFLKKRLSNIHPQHYSTQLTTYHQDN